MAALPAAFALSLLRFRMSGLFFAWVILHRVLPPIATLVPLVFIYHQLGLRDSYAGVIMAHAAVNLPLAVLLLKSFFDDVPREVGDAAMIDGATRMQSFLRIHAPMIRGGIAATATLCFVFSWTEFLMALFLTSEIRLLPVQISLMTQSWGLTSALGTISLLPVFVFILLVQRHLVRGMTMGLARD
jgi:multiple sugar transport system permease protein